MNIFSFDIKGGLKNVPKWAWIMVAGAVLVFSIGITISVVIDSWHEASEEHHESHDPEIAHPGNTGDPGTNAPAEDFHKGKK